MSEKNPLDVVRYYLAAIEKGDPEALAACCDPAIEQTEFPNLLNPKGQARGLAGMIDGLERGKALLAAQSYEIINAVVDGERVAVEMKWAGELAVPVAGLAKGDTMKAHFAAFFTLVDGRIASQHNYDCFEPFS
jgi:ketosteroid isomerase-like protein